MTLLTHSIKLFLIKAKYEELEKVMAEKNTEMEKMKEAAHKKIRKLEVEVIRVSTLFFNPQQY